MTSAIETTTHPYSSPLAHLEAEIAALTAKCRRLSLERDCTSFASEETTARLSWLRMQEQATREKVDARTQASIDAGVTFPLVTLRKTLDLSEVEMTTLLMASLPAFGLDLGDVLAGLQIGMGWGGVSVNTVAAVCGLDLDGRVKLLATLGKDGRLVQAGLVKVEEVDDGEPDAVWCATLCLTQTGFNAITGTLEVPND